MELSTMTIDDFLKFADIYEYTQDHFNIQKAIMEMTLTQMQLLSYDYLLENNDNIDLSQIDVLMVESGLNDQSLMLENVFLEEGEGIFAALGKLLKMIGNAFVSFFSKIANVFKGGSDKSAELEVKNKELDEKLKQLDIINKLASVGDGMINNAVNDQLQQAVSSINTIVQEVSQTTTNITTRLNQVIGGGGPKVSPINVSTDNGIRVLLDDATALSKTNSNGSILDYQAALCQPSYNVEMLKFIADIEKLPEKISKIIVIKSDTDSGSEIIYNSIKNMKLTGNKNHFEEIEYMIRDIEAECKTYAKFTMSAETLQSKLDAANKLNTLFDKVATMADIGPVDNSNVMNKFINDKLVRTADQIDRSDKLVNNAKQNMKNDEDFKFKLKPKGGWADQGKRIAGREIKKANFINEYPMYVSELYKLAQNLQSAISASIKVLNEHMKVRNEAMNNQIALTNSINKIVSIYDSQIAPQLNQSAQQSAAPVQQPAQQASQQVAPAPQVQQPVQQPTAPVQQPIAQSA